ncbi:UNVERIFIED_CONTAM: hypothetical protein Slati_0897500 [Sesamum latifolium]|uniref:Reverse transcriptase domain-containing protein n=1 Tax=Sesamum latifolium TaxID=2727402 RepID=A0AAW2XNW8_9LAMI
MFSFTRKLKLLKPVFRKLKKAKGDLGSNIEQATTFLAKIQQLLMGNRNCTLLLELEKYCRLVYSKAMAQEQLLLKQRVKLKWLKEGDVNATVLALIPKVQLHREVADYRPIACCNVIYKVITKIMVTRMKGVLHKLIDPSQNAFVPGQNISDNILLVQELFLEYNQKRLPPRCALKVDLRKAYDTVEWDLLTATLKLFKFPVVFIHWVTECVSTISLNGSIHGYFHVSVQQQIEQLLGFATGPLPIKYLGLPLISSRLTSGANYEILLGTLHNYWSSSFILPKGITMCIERKLRSFIWKECDGQGYAKVHWEQVCLPKESGGLDIKSVSTTNTGLMSKHLWAIITNNQHSLWVRWIQIHRLKNKTVWTASPSVGSWGWKKLLKLRTKLMQHINYSVGDEAGIWLWQDPWLKGEILIQKYPRGPMVTGLSCDAKLQDVILDGEWNWPDLRSIIVARILEELPVLQPPKDRITWPTSPSGKLTLSAAYSLFSPDGDKVVWACLFLSPFKIAQMHFILCLAILGSFSTTDNPWLHIPKVTCCLCDDEVLETHDHIFCQCPFISQCLRILKRDIRLTWLDLLGNIG